MAKSKKEIVKVLTEVENASTIALEEVTKIKMSDISAIGIEMFNVYFAEQKTKYTAKYQADYQSLTSKINAEKESLKALHKQFVSKLTINSENFKFTYDTYHMALTEKARNDYITFINSNLKYHTFIIKSHYAESYGPFAFYDISEKLCPFHPSIIEQEKSKMLLNFKVSLYDAFVKKTINTANVMESLSTLVKQCIDESITQIYNSSMNNENKELKNG